MTPSELIKLTDALMDDIYRLRVLANKSQNCHISLEKSKVKLPDELFTTTFRNTCDHIHATVSKLPL